MTCRHQAEGGGVLMKRGERKREQLTRPIDKIRNLNNFGQRHNSISDRCTYRSIVAIISSMVFSRSEETGVRGGVCPVPSPAPTPILSASTFGGFPELFPVIDGPLLMYVCGDTGTLVGT